MSPAKPSDVSPGTESTTARASRLADVSNQLSEMITSLRQSREAHQTRRHEPLLTPLPGAQLASSPAVPTAGEVVRLRAELAVARQAEAELRARLDEIEEVNVAVGDELVALQAQMAHAAAVAVVLQRLHQAATPAEVLDGLQEVVINILGCEDFAVLALRGGRPEVARRMGRTVEEAEALAADAALAAAVAAGQVLAGDGAAALAPGLSLLVPLAARDRTVGAAALFQLLPQKGSLGPFDLEVAELLQTHAALAWQAVAGSVDGR